MKARSVLLCSIKKKTTHTQFCLLSFCLSFMVYAVTISPRHFDLSSVHKDTAVNSDSEFLQNWTRHITVLCGRPCWCHPVVFGFLHQSHMTLPCYPAAVSGSTCGLCIFTSDLWSWRYFCKHSNLSATAAFHLKAFVCLGMPARNAGFLCGGPKPNEYNQTWTEDTPN